MPVPTEDEIRRFLEFYGDQGFWCKADGRTVEGRAQKEALANGWIESMPNGSGYRILAAAPTS
jgi:hypothetical protein